MTLEEEVRELAKFAKAASVKLAQATTEERNGALLAMAAALRAQAPAIVEANGEDMEAARAAGTTEALLDRLVLDEPRVFAMADALEEVAALPDPLGVVSLESTLYNGIELRRVSVPLGVVAMVYEARPNVTADAAGVCVKSGNACILRGGSLAARSNEVIADVLAAAAVEAGLPEGSICAVTTTDRAATDVLMGLHDLVDVLIPRGGAGLIRHCVEYAKVPVIETGTGNCHVYVHASADPAMARDIIKNAKCRRYGVCNAAETLLVDAAVADAVLPPILADMKEAGVARSTAMRAYSPSPRRPGFPRLATHPTSCSPTRPTGRPSIWGPSWPVKCVEGLQEAIDHVNRYGTKHSEAIVASDEAAQDAFLAQVDAAAGVRQRLHGLHRRRPVRPWRRDRHLHPEDPRPRALCRRRAHLLQVRVARRGPGEGLRAMDGAVDSLAQRARAGTLARLGIMGGTFDPPHLGHLACAEEALEAANLDAVLFVPTAVPPSSRIVL